ncbi:MAG: repeat-containing protein [Ignavibacteria bacterium]|nr:repeat-containing protein [Ignavibacteria bacterium]
MKIADANISMVGSRIATSYTEVKETLTMWSGNQSQTVESKKTGSPAVLNSVNTKFLNNNQFFGLPKMLDSFAKNFPPPVIVSKIKANNNNQNNAKSLIPLPKVDLKPINSTTSKEDDSQLDPEIKLLKDLLEILLGKKIDLHTADYTKIQANIEKQQAKYNKMREELNAGNPMVGTPQVPDVQNNDAGLEYNRTVMRYESESMQFSASGIIKTADGQEIKFNLSLEMTREHYEESNLNIQIGTPRKQDPLVVNFDGTAARLTDKQFTFDLNNDGKAENMNFPGFGSGFLTLDRNNDGAITNGTELFGTSTGNGFSELSAFDSDKNGWLDESDPAFGNLGILTKDDSGKDAIYSLQQKNIGALYLKNQDTAFTFKSSLYDNPSGEVVSSGAFLRNDGSAGTLQQINLFA